MDWFRPRHMTWTRPMTALPTTFVLAIGKEMLSGCWVWAEYQPRPASNYLGERGDDALERRRYWGKQRGPNRRKRESRRGRGERKTEAETETEREREIGTERDTESGFSHTWSRLVPGAGKLHEQITTLIFFFCGPFHSFAIEEVITVYGFTQSWVRRKGHSWCSPGQPNKERESPLRLPLQVPPSPWGYGNGIQSFDSPCCSKYWFAVPLSCCPAAWASQSIALVHCPSPLGSLPSCIVLATILDIWHSACIWAIKNTFLLCVQERIHKKSLNQKQEDLT